MFDIRIINGQVLDGTGAPAIEADVGIVGERIQTLGALAGAEAKLTLDAAGCYVVPGFIDAHSHSDAYLLIEPSAAGKVYQGVTTEIVGNCGASAAPLTGAYHLPSDWLEHTFPGEWSTVAEYRELFERVKPAVNAVLLIGHNTLRAGVVGYGNRPASAEELAGMIRLLEQGLDEGGRGLSTGLIYAPGMFAPHGELTALCRAAAARGAIYTTHMRSEGARLLESIDDTLSLGRETGIRLEISHLKTSGRSNWGRIDDALERIRAARAEGLEVAADRYPYTSSCTDLDVIFPEWAAEGGREAVLARLRDPASRDRLRAELLASRAPEYWSTITVGSTSHPDNRRFQGRPLPDVAAALGVEPVDAVLRLTESDGLKTGAFFSGMCEANMLRILAEPYVMIGSDASVRAPTGPLSHDYPHPRAYGTFPRFLRMALNGLSVSLPEAIRKMTSLPAAHFGLHDRGVLAAGKAADIVVFDPRRVEDTAGYARPHALARGIEHLVVNGVPTLKDGAPTGKRAGRFL